MRTGFDFLVDVAISGAIAIVIMGGSAGLLLLISIYPMASIIFFIFCFITFMVYREFFYFNPRGGY